MGKQLWKAGNMLYPLPAVLVSCADKDGNANVLTVAWTGTICSEPPMVYISVRKSRYSHQMLVETGEFYINLTTEAMVFATDYCGVKSGRHVNKFAEMKLTPEMGILAHAPMIQESPVCIACQVERIEELGSHDMFIAKVLGVYADERYMDENGRFDLSIAAPMVYSHGQYYGLGKNLGKFGYSVQKKPMGKKKAAEIEQKEKQTKKTRTIKDKSKC